MRCTRLSILSDENGLLTQEWIFILAVCVIGIVAGLSVLRDSIDVSFTTGAQAIGAVDPGYTISDYVGNGYTVNGSTYTGGTITVAPRVYSE